MTTKDIRDIAAYWGSPCKYERRRWVVNAMIIEFLQARIILGVKTRRGSPIRVQLRPISSLTDEEVRELASIALPKHDFDFFSRPITIEGRIVRAEFRLIYKSGVELQITVNPPFSVIFITRGQELADTGAIIAYLQSIHVYIPGTIDEKYVNLVE